MNRLHQEKQLFISALTSKYDKAESEAIFNEIRQNFGLDYAKITMDSQKTDLFFQHLELVQHELLQGRPLQYILGKAWFYGLELTVNESVLIPRPETEELLHYLFGLGKSFENILDIGTGSGCIALKLKKQFPESHIEALDISQNALAVAKQNANNLQLAVNFIQADIAEWEYVFPSDKAYDLIISNPPYIRPSEKKDMEDNVLQHEPNLALFVEEENPLIFYQIIAEMAIEHLKPYGILAFEINQYLGKETIKLIRSKGFTTVNLLKDMHGNDRMLIAMR